MCHCKRTEEIEKVGVVNRIQRDRAVYYVGVQTNSNVLDNNRKENAVYLIRFPFYVTQKQHFKLYYRCKRFKTFHEILSLYSIKAFVKRYGYG